MRLAPKMAQQRVPDPPQSAPPAATAGASGVSFPSIDFSAIRVPTEVSRSGTAAGEVTATTSRPPATTPDVSPQSPESIRQLLLSSPEQLAIVRARNPVLAEAVNDAKKFASIIEEQQKRMRDEMRLRMADPFDVEAQRRIAENIQQTNIDASMEHAMEFLPESFGQVIMLYICCEVNGQPVKAFVDSGAQMTIMSEACARRCNIERLIDRRWAGVAKGVGTQKIVGRVHLGQIKIGSAFLPSSFTILVDQEMDLLLGLDMLRRHQCVIDLAQNRLVFSSSGVETPFLPESELPTYARLSNQPDFPASPGGATAAPEDPLMEEKVQKITSNGFSREAAIAELRAAGGDLDKALATLLAKSLSQ